MSKTYFSIRYKILCVFGVLLLLAVSVYTWLASTIFRQEKVALLYEINHSFAVNAAAQLRSAVVQTSEQITHQILLRILSESGSTGIRMSPKTLERLRVQRLQLFKKDGKNYKGVPLGIDFPTMNYSEADYKHYLNEAEETGYSFWIKNQEKEKLTDISVAAKFEVTFAQRTDVYVIIIELDGKFFFEPLQSANLFKAYLVNKQGEVLVHCDKNKISPHRAIANHPLLKVVSEVSDGKASGVRSYQFDNESWYGAYAPIGIGNLFLISQANRSEVQTALDFLVRQSLTYGLFVLTFTFLVSILFAHKLTRNLHVLTESTRRIGEGDLTTQIEVSSHDEVQQLASSFNQMTQALKVSRDKIEDYNRELEGKVEARTLELKEKNVAIKNAQEALLKTTQLAAVGEVAGRTAHEVLNPLTAIISRSERCVGYLSGGEKNNVASQFKEILGAWDGDLQSGGVDLLFKNLRAPSAVKPEVALVEEDVDNLKKLLGFWEEQQQIIFSDFEFIHNQGNRIYRIINQLRELNRNTSVKQEVRCYEALKEALMTLSDFIAKRGVLLKGRLDAQKDLAFLNRDEFIQIITNLMRNAVQAISTVADEERRKMGCITIRTMNENNYLYVDIIDNGVGIPTDRQALIFEAGLTTKAPSEGTGLGLSICRRYARAFGGEVILLFSAPDKGTCFRLMIPLKKEKFITAADEVEKAA